MFAVFLILKLAGCVDWGWPLVCAPLWIPALGCVASFLILLPGAAVAVASDE